MTNYTSDCYEMKRESVNYAKFLTKNCNKPTKGFFIDMIYGIGAAKDIKISNIARTLKENEKGTAKLDNTIERLCLHLGTSINHMEEIENQYKKYVNSMIPEYPKVIFDNTDIVKIYGSKFEDLDQVIDASDPKKTIKPGYPVINAVVISKNQKQPIPIYSKIVSTKSDNFESMNTYTYESVDKACEMVEGRFLGIFDRGYDDKKMFRYLDEKEVDFIIRLKGNRNFLFKGKSKNVLQQAQTRKGQIVFNATFQKEKKDLMISYTKANLPDGEQEEYTIVFVYGFSEKEPMLLITNKDIKNAHDARVIVRAYLDRWRIEEVHRAEKTEYNYEDMRVRSLQSLNNLNTIFMMFLGLLAKLADSINTRLLSIKIIERSQSLKENLVVLIGMMARGIKEILSYAHTGIQEYKNQSNKKRLEEISEQLSLDFE